MCVWGRLFDEMPGVTTTTEEEGAAAAAKDDGGRGELYCMLEQASGKKGGRAAEDGGNGRTASRSRSAGRLHRFRMSDVALKLPRRQVLSGVTLLPCADGEVFLLDASDAKHVRKAQRSLLRSFDSNAHHADRAGSAAKCRAATGTTPAVGNSTVTAAEPEEQRRGSGGAEDASPPQPPLEPLQPAKRMHRDIGGVWCDPTESPLKRVDSSVSPRTRGPRAE